MCNITNASCSEDVLQGLAYCPVFLMGFLVNTAALRAFMAIKDSWTDTHIYMFNLALADFSLIIFLPFRIYNNFFCLEKSFWCTFLINTHFINMYASILTTTAISMQRYVAIRFPLQARSWRRKKGAAIAVCLLIWGVLLVICGVFQKENSTQNLWTCYERCKDKPLSLQIIVILMIVGFLAPLLIIVFCSTQIILLLKKADARSASLQRSITGIVTANMLVFIICYTPIHVGFLVNYLQPVPENWPFVHMPAHAYLQVSEWIASTNCCLDSFGYYFLLKRFYS
ncbi:G-protein coupled receptor 35 [Aulostomus maculatus]